MAKQKPTDDPIPEDAKKILKGEDQPKEEPTDKDYKTEYERLLEEHRNLQKVLGEQGRELGELRKTIEQLRQPGTQKPEPEPPSSTFWGGDEPADDEFVSKAELKRLADDLAAKVQRQLEERLNEAIYGPEGVVGRKIVQEFRELNESGLSEDQIKAVYAYMNAKGMTSPKEAWSELRKIAGASAGGGGNGGAPRPPSFRGESDDVGSGESLEELIARFDHLPPEKQDEVLRKLDYSKKY